jgi:uncharacterized membrane protein
MQAIDNSNNCCEEPKNKSEGELINKFGNPISMNLDLGATPQKSKSNNTDYDNSLKDKSLISLSKISSPLSLPILVPVPKTKATTP